jgi:hypothetical protein
VITRGRMTLREYSTWVEVQGPIGLDQFASRELARDYLQRSALRLRALADDCLQLAAELEMEIER